MDIKVIIEKLKKGEALDDAEKKALAEFDLQKHVDGAQAEARRRAEQKAAEEAKEREKLAAQIADLEKKLQAKDGEKLSETEKLQQAIRDLSAKFEASEKRSAELAAAQAKAQRSAKVQEIAKKLGVVFVDGVDPKILAGALEATLASVGDDKLDDESLVKPLVESFKTANKAVIRDQSGGGGGTPPMGGGGNPDPNQSTADRAKWLAKQTERKPL